MACFLLIVVVIVIVGSMNKFGTTNFRPVLVTEKRNKQISPSASDNKVEDLINEKVEHSFHDVLSESRFIDNKKVNLKTKQVSYGVGLLGKIRTLEAYHSTKQTPVKEPDVKADVKVSVDIRTDKPIHITDERYLSLGLDVNLIRHRWVTFNFTSQRLITMAKALSPAYIRVSGTDADRMLFDKDAVNVERDSQDELDEAIQRMEDAMSKPPVRDLFPPRNFTMTGKDWDNINKFAKLVGWRIMFSFNAQLRKAGGWDSSNAQQILDYSVKNGYHDNLDFELGNEPDNYMFQTGFVLINGTQFGNDVIQLDNLLKSSRYGHSYKKSMIVGPGIAFSKKPQYLTDFLNKAGHIIKAVTWHHYYGGGELRYIENYTDPDLLDSYSNSVKSVKSGRAQQNSKSTES